MTRSTTIYFIEDTELSNAWADGTCYKTSELSQKDLECVYRTDN